MIRVGTRGSALALAQARWVAERIDGETALVTITAEGPVGDKSRWVSALEQALLGDAIDLAVHSAKDVPAEIPDGLELVAIPVRADPSDAICGAASLAELPHGARVGTSSLRRAAQIRAVREDVEIVAVRGNVDTRLRKLGEGECDALVLALAGLQRLGREDDADGVLHELVPAAGQGALALESRNGAILDDVLGRVRDRETTVCVTAERELTRALGASCNTPVGACARAVGGALELRSWVGLPDGSHWISDLIAGPAPGLGLRAAERLRSSGADEVLRAAEREHAA